MMSVPNSLRYLEKGGAAMLRPRAEGWKSDVLPNTWNQSVSDVVLIFNVTGQLPHKYFFFVQDTCNENGYKRRKQKQCPPRSKRKWRANEKKQSGKVHRMTDKSVYAGRDHFLSLFDTDIGSSIGIHFRYEVENVERERNECAACD